MDDLRHWIRDAWIGLAYFALATAAILTSRFDGGLAYLWVANAMLITVLGQRPRHAWTPAIAWGAIGSLFATGLWGIGWAVAPALALANMAEAWLAAYLLLRGRAGLLPLGSPKWFAKLIVAAGIAGPLAMGVAAAVPLQLAVGHDPIDTMIRVILGHGLSNLIIIPIFQLFATADSGLWRRQQKRMPGPVVRMLFAVQLVVTIAVFSQQHLPLLFLTLLPVIAIVFRGASRCSAISLLLLAGISCGATLMGRGPMNLDGLHPGEQVLLLEVFLLAAVLTIVPIAVQIRRNSWLAERVVDSEARYRMLADHSGDIIMHSDERGILRFVSPSIERVGGYLPEDLVGRPTAEIIHPDFHALVHEHYTFAMRGEGRDTRFEYRARRGDGRWGWFESECRGLSDRDGPRGAVSIIRDISERKEREEQLALAAMTDPLTGLPNRRAFRESTAALDQDRRSQPACIALLDIDHFKSVNDRFGHDVGDEVLQSFALTALQQLREGDTIARYGGEEFAVLFRDIDEGGAIALCDRLRVAVATSVCLTSKGPVRFTISGGVAALGAGGLDAALTRADTALYEAKSQGRDRLLRAAA